MRKGKGGTYRLIVLPEEIPVIKSASSSLIEEPEERAVVGLFTTGLGFGCATPRLKENGWDMWHKGDEKAAEIKINPCAYAKTRAWYSLRFRG